MYFIKLVSIDTVVKLAQPVYMTLGQKCELSQNLLFCTFFSQKSICFFQKPSIIQTESYPPLQIHTHRHTVFLIGCSHFFNIVPFCSRFIIRLKSLSLRHIILYHALCGLILYQPTHTGFEMFELHVLILGVSCLFTPVICQG